MFTHSSGNPELEKVLERKMMENLRCRVPSVETELNEPESSSGKGKRMRVWESEKCVKRFSGRLVVFLPLNLCGLNKVFLDTLH